MREVARSLQPLLASQLVVTIAAGIRVKDLSRWLGGYPRIVRVMPNTPALVHAGISGLYAPAAVGPADRAAAGKVLGAVGGILWLEREEDLDAVTAVSGSGPAYVFYFIEALERAARELGLAADAAHRLAIETFAGAVKLAAQAGEPPETLRSRVTSKGGTTERALNSMETDRVKDAIVRAVKAAADRSRELGDESGRD
jgi:pyrroline-5-carboxylate reductase